MECSINSIISMYEYSFNAFKCKKKSKYFLKINLLILILRLNLIMIKNSVKDQKEEDQNLLHGVMMMIKYELFINSI